MIFWWFFCCQASLSKQSSNTLGSLGSEGQNFRLIFWLFIQIQVRKWLNSMYNRVMTDFFLNVLSKICVAGGEGGKGGEGSTITAVCEHRHLPRSDDQVWLLDITDCRWPTKQQRNEKSIWECSFHSGFRPAPARPCPSVSFCTLLHQKQTPPPWRKMRSHTHPSGNTTAGALCH